MEQTNESHTLSMMGFKLVFIHFPQQMIFEGKNLNENGTEKLIQNFHLKISKYKF